VKVDLKSTPSLGSVGYDVMRQLALSVAKLNVYLLLDISSR
jgi:hypothetical protein